MFVRDDPIELGERIESLLCLLVVWKRQRVHGRPASLVFKPFGDVELARDEWAFEVQPRSRGFQATQVVAADAKLRERVVQFPFPLVTGPPGLDGYQARGE